MHTVIRTAVHVAVLGSFAATAGAQTNTNAMHINVAAGATLPTGTFSDAVDVGYHLTGGVGVQDRALPLGFRAEVSYDSFGGKRGFGNLHAIGFTGNGSYDFTNGGVNGTTFYLIGGLGFYNVGGDNGGSDTNFGWNVGGGFRWPLSGFSAYIEARFHSVTNTNVRFVPITFGLRF
jgi:Outer membrane protein beta-barrel domain